MGRWFRATENPVLVAQHEKLWRRLRAVQGMPEVQTDFGSHGPANDQLSVDVGSQVARLSQLSAEERAELGLRLLLDQVQASAGYLFVVKEGEPSLIAPLHGEEPPPALYARLAHDLSSSTDMDATIATGDKGPLRAERRSDIATQVLYVVYLLENGTGVAGMLAAQQPEGRALRRPRPTFMSAVAAALFDASDTSRTSAPEVP